MLLKSRWFLSILLCGSLGLSWAAACGLGGQSPAEVKTLLYVLDNINDAVYVVEGITSVEGPQDSARTIAGDKTLIETPTDVAVDGRRDILYVLDANQQAVLVFAPASQRDGNVAPSRTLPAGPNPQALTFDETGNRLYVSEVANQEILVWDNVSSADNQVPDRTFFLGFLASSIFIDTNRDLLYVGDPVSKAIQVYTQASQTIGSPSPAATLTDAEVAFSRINSLTMNKDLDTLYVAESQNPSVEIFRNASTLNGAVTPDRALEGAATGLTGTMRHNLFLNNVLYLNTNDTMVGIWDNANNVDGDQTPDRIITVNPATQIKSFDIDLRH